MHAGLLQALAAKGHADLALAPSLLTEPDSSVIGAF